MNMAILDVAIGLIFTFLTLSLMATVIQELIAQALNLRGKTLWAFLAKILGGADSALAKALRDHPRIASLGPGKALPDAIPALTFAKALAEVLESDPATKAQALQGPLAPFLKPYLEDMEKFQTEVADWYDGAMTKVSVWYRAKAQRVLLIIGFVLAAALNVSALDVGRALWINEDLREVAVAQAETYAKAHADTTTPLNREMVHELRKQLNSLNLPIGWEDQDLDRLESGWAWLHFLVGWLLTALAVSLGSQFWYDSLRKLVTFRETLTGSKK